MTQWKDFPNEVVSKIAEILNASTSNTKWMFVNKQLNEIYHSLEFKDIKIRLNARLDKKFNAIVNSVWNPGQKVRKIYVEDFAAPTEENFTYLNKAVDPLYLLMRHCPSVKNFNFQALPKQESQALAWEYFSYVLMDCDIWNLETLPSPIPMLNCCSSAYFNCAYYMRNTLTVLYLTKGMIGRRDLQRLRDFQQLERVMVRRHVAHHLYDCDNILMALPQSVTALELGSFGMYNQLTTDNKDSSSNNSNTITYNTTYKYNQIKEIIFHRYFPMTDQELIYIMEHYTGLKTLSMKDNYVVSWPSTTISKTVMESFMKWASDLESCNIIISGNSDDTWLLNAWLSRQDNPNSTTSDIPQVEFNIKLVKRTDIVSGADFQLSLQSCKSNCPTLSASLTHKFNNQDRTILTAMVERYLVELNQKIHKFTLELPKSELQFGDVINSMLSTAHPDLQQVGIYKGNLCHYHNDNENSQQGRHLDRLEFRDADIGDKCLNSLVTAKFTSLGLLKFCTCTIIGDNGIRSSNMNIIMPETTIGLLHIDNCVLTRRPTLLISVYSTTQNVAKYYFNANAEDKSTTEINQANFNALKQNIKAENMAVISVTAKSIKKLKIQGIVANTNTYREIELNIL